MVITGSFVIMSPAAWWTAIDCLLATQCHVGNEMVVAELSTRRRGGGFQTDW